MDTIPEIDVDEAARRHAAGGTLFMDVRDPASYAAAHIPGAVHVNDDGIEAFLRDTPRTQPVVVVCFHGHMSLGGAAYLLGHGFTNVCSMTGGFEAWRGRHPEESGRA